MVVRSSCYCNWQTNASHIVDIGKNNKIIKQVKTTSKIFTSDSFQLSTVFYTKYRFIMYNKKIESFKLLGATIYSDLYFIVSFPMIFYNNYLALYCRAFIQQYTSGTQQDSNMQPKEAI